MWAVAYRSVLRQLGIADWWHLSVSPADADALLISVDYQPRALAAPERKSS